MERNVGAVMAHRAYFGNAERSTRLEVGEKEYQANFHENAFPQQAEAEMERLYGSVFSTFGQFSVYAAPNQRFCCYVLRRSTETVAVILFSRDGKTARVMNEVASFSEETIDRFCRHLFAAYAEIEAVSFHAIQTGTANLAFPSLRYNCLEDIALRLPDTEQAYFNSLGKNTRRNLKRYGDRMLAAFPDFQFEVYEGGAASEADVRAIIALNHARMAGKNTESFIDRSEADRIVRLVRRYGVVGVARIGGKVCAGTIGYRVRDNLYLSVLAHAPEYDAYWIGMLVCYRKIKACIERGCREFHFLWGRYEYKFTFLGKLRDLDHLTIFRSPMHRLLNFDLVLKAAIAAQKRRVQLALHETKHHHQYDFWTRALVGAARAIRGIKLSLVRCLGALRRR